MARVVCVPVPDVSPALGSCHGLALEQLLVHELQLGQHVLGGETILLPVSQTSLETDRQRNKMTDKQIDMETDKWT